MKVKYFEDTDTTLVEFSNNPPVETQELNENLYLDLDSEGRVVSITIEYAGQAADLREFLYQRIPAGITPT
jgi:uncharacterized protein YuzE